MQSRVIVFNGVGSVGKSSTAKALQSLSVEPFLHVQGDAFLEMIPPWYWGDPSGIIFRHSERDAKPSIEIEMGPALDRLMEGMRRSVATLAGAGNSCIVDDVMLSAGDQRAYLDACSGVDIQFVALRAPLEIIEQRERERGDRVIGLARWQFQRVHAGVKYDCEIDATAGQPEQIARAIGAALDIPLRDI